MICISSIVMIAVYILIANIKIYRVECALWQIDNLRRRLHAKNENSQPKGNTAKIPLP